MSDRRRQEKTKLYAGHSALTWGILAVSLLLLFFIYAVWSSASKVEGVYRFIKQESRSTPSDAEKAYINANLKSGKSPGGKLDLRLGVMSSELTLFKPDGKLFKQFSGDRPLFYKSDISEIDPVTGTVLQDPQGNTWSYEYIRIIGGYPNLKLIQWDRDKQFIKKWIYTLDAPLTPVRLNGATPGTRREPEYTPLDPGMKK